MKNTEFTTPCGFKITLASINGVMVIKSEFDGMPISFVNSNYQLSDEGVQMLAERIAGLYAGD